MTPNEKRLIRNSWKICGKIPLFLILSIFLSSCASTESHIGLEAGRQFSADGSCSAVWIPYRFKDSLEDIALISKCVPYSEDQEIFMRNALEVLLQGLGEVEEEGGLVFLVRKARVLDVKVRRGIAIVNLSKEFAPVGGSTAVWHARTAVHELFRQFPRIRAVKIQIEGIPEEESLQP